MTLKHVKTADRTLNVFEVFAAVKEPLSLVEIARELESPVSSCHGLVRTLAARGYLYLLEYRKRYYPTRRLLDISNEIASHDPLVTQLIPTLESLRDKTKETVIVGKRQGNFIIHLAVLEGPHTIRYAADIGDLKPLHSSALGKSYLSSETDEDLAVIAERLPKQRHTKNTITETERLLEDVRETRKRGYAVTRSENAPDVSAAARTFLIDTESIGVAIAGPSHRMDSVVDAIGQLLVETFPDSRPTSMDFIDATSAQ